MRTQQLQNITGKTSPIGIAYQPVTNKQNLDASKEDPIKLLIWFCDLHDTLIQQYR